MIVKAVEIRDAMTFVPALAIKMVPETEGERYLLRRAGYGFSQPLIMLVRMSGGEAHYDPYCQPTSSRTMREAHKWIAQHFDEIGASGDVVDVQFILGETKEPKRSEQFEAPP